MAIQATIQPDGRARPCHAGMGLHAGRDYPVHVPAGRTAPKVGATVHVQPTGFAANTAETKVRVIVR